MDNRTFYFTNQNGSKESEALYSR